MTLDVLGLTAERALASLGKFASLAGTATSLGIFLRNAALGMSDALAV